jgi:2-C-methyl-D-erythritol 4-phosphate cytidylyltransferase/2-C-methyl-D-erythritol 2,4-cyclodiphosphate synthase
MNGTSALIPAAGRGARFGSPENKVFAELLGRPLLGWTLEAFARCAAVDSVVLVGAEGDLARLREIGDAWGGGKVTAVVAGGADRQASVRAGLAALPAGAEYVVVHDGARPCVTPEIIEGTLAAARAVQGGATAAVRVSDTLVREFAHPHRTYEFEGGEIGWADQYVYRDGVWAIQTPQAFRAAGLRDAHEAAHTSGFTGTDDLSVYRHAGGEHTRGYLVTGSPENLKVTRPEDLALAEAILMRRAALSDSHPGSPRLATPLSQAREGLEDNPSASYSPSSRSRERGPGGESPPFSVGHGYDVHQFAEGRRLWLGGVEFPEAPRGLLGHSDADVVLHAVCDALLGAAGLGDIGKLFPPSDMRHKDRPSIEFLEEVKARLDAAGWRVGNLDITVLAETPKIGPRADDIRARIAVTLGIDTGRVGVKATTNEGMGFVGRGEGIAAHATALLFR